MILEAIGVNGELEVYENKIIITRKGWIARTVHSKKGDKIILINQIESIQFKPWDRWQNGYIQFVLSGGYLANGNISIAVKDENTIMFNQKQQEIFEEAKRTIEDLISSNKNNNSSNQSTHTNLDELEKLANLKEKGIITEDEFIAKKKQLLGL